jgi:phosphoenolpyruvate carboxylase
MRMIPATMSTQHPDNVARPSWSKEDVIAGDTEIEETYFAFSELGCQEQMWDWEGKDADPNVVRKLLTGYPAFFKNHKLGQDVFLTYRVPNPSVEKTEQKALIEALASIPRSYDLTSTFYSEDIPPVFEVILPMTTSAKELLRVSSYYEQIVARLDEKNVAGGEDASMLSWVGEFKPKGIEVIPLLENFESLLHVDQIVEEYVTRRHPPYVRVFLGRSDPALNYGMIAAVLLAKVALSKLRGLSLSARIPIYPIIGVGSLPFRGNLTPLNLRNFIEEYSGVRTVTIQSALKYDFELESTKSLIQTLNEKLPRGEPPAMTQDEVNCLEQCSRKLTLGYQMRVEKLADLVNNVANYVPRRRERRLHIGLFGYGRELGTITLPRAINFAASLYSIGIPPEILGLQALSNLTELELRALNKYYPHWKTDVEWAGNYVCWENLNMMLDDAEIVTKISRPYNLSAIIPQILADIEAYEQQTGVKVGPRTLSQRKHYNIANNTLIALAEDTSDVSRYVVESGRLRYSLG